MQRWIGLLVLAFVILPACRASEEILHRGEVLTYEQYRSIKIEDHLSADRIRELFGRPQVVHEDNGKVSRIIYRCQDSTNSYRDLELIFDKNEILREKRL